MITIISATNRKGSNALKIAHYYKGLLDEQGIENELLSLEALPESFLSDNMYGKRTDEFRPIEAQLKLSTGYVFVVPEYNGSFPGVLKLLIDSMDPKKVFKGKKAVLVGESTGKFGNLRGLEHLTNILNYVGITVLHFKAHLMQVDKMLNAEGLLTDVSAIAELREQIVLMRTFFAEPQLA